MITGNPNPTDTADPAEGWTPVGHLDWLPRCHRCGLRPTSTLYTGMLATAGGRTGLVLRCRCGKVRALRGQTVAEVWAYGRLLWPDHMPPRHLVWWWVLWAPRLTSAALCVLLLRACL